jgi:hypothetical protein
MKWYVSGGHKVHASLRVRKFLCFSTYCIVFLYFQLISCTRYRSDLFMSPRAVNRYVTTPGIDLVKFTSVSL